MRSRKLLALLFCLITFPAIAGYMTLLGAGVGSIAPVASWVSTTDPTFPSSSLTFSRTSLATMFDSTGKLTYAPNNLLTQSNTFSNAAWTKQFTTVASGATDRLGGTSAWTVTATSANGQLYASISVSTAASTNFIPSLWIKRRTGTGNIKFYNPAATVATIIAVDNTWKQFYIPGLGTGTSAYITLLIETSGDAVDISEATLSAVTYETSPRTADQVITTSSAYYGPRIDYDPNTLAVKGLLIEEARTNLALQSADHSSASWTKVNVAATANATTSPDGTTSATKLAETAVSGSHAEFNATGVSITSGTTYTGSTFVKAAERSIVIVAVELGGVSYGKYIDLSAGTIGSTFGSAPDSSSIQNCGNGWYRVVMTKAASSTGATGYIMTYGALTDGGGSTYLGVAGSGYYRWGSQFETGSFATSYIPTAAASVTRAADVVQFTGAALTALQGSAFSAIGEAQTIAAPAVQAVLFGANSDVAFVYAPSVNNQSAFYDGTSLVAVATAGGGRTWSGLARAGIGVSGSTASEVMTGGTVATGSHALPARTTAYLGTYSGGAYLNGWVKSFAIYNQRLPDATLQAKSVVGASYAANDNGLRFADNDNLPIHWRIAL